MRGEHIFASAQRDWESPPEFEDPKAPILPDEGTCPHCRNPLQWDGLDDTKAWCETQGCRYDNGLSEVENRRLWEESKK
jgi:hypothetical protein